MANSGNNPRFEILVNGRVVCTCGIEQIGVLVAGVDWVHRDPNRRPTDYTESEWIRNAIDLRVGGLDSATERHVLWVNRSLSVGDEVLIRVLSPGDFDEPVPMRKSDD